MPSRPGPFCGTSCSPRTTRSPRAHGWHDDITAVAVGGPDPAAAAALWADIIGLQPVAPAKLDFSGCAIEFAAHPRKQLLAATFRLARGADLAALPAALLGLRATYTA
jgi:hypothetical protein